MDLPIKNGDFHSYVSLPEGTFIYIYMGNIRFIWLVAHDLILAKLLKLFLLAETQCLLIELTSFVRHQNLALG